MDAVGATLLELNDAAVRAAPFLKSKLLEMGLVPSNANAVALPPHRGISRQPRKPPYLREWEWKMLRRAGLW